MQSAIDAFLGLSEHAWLMFIVGFYVGIMIPAGILLILLRRSRQDDPETYLDEDLRRRLQDFDDKPRL